MNKRKFPLGAGLFLLTCAAVYGGSAKTKPPKEAAGPAVLWVEPQDLKTRDLFYGPGGKKHEPKPPFTFVKEDLEGTNPKFTVTDADGTKWKVKLGNEARPETTATRLVWAAGYFADEDYLLKDLRVSGMPPKLHRGQKLIAEDGSIPVARLKREAGKKEKLGYWRWDSDAFSGTRELNGLRALMAVINNWDLKDLNNAIRQEGDTRIYMVSDLGASFGTAGRGYPRETSKGCLETYQRSKFIRKINPTTVDFQTPARPRYVFIVDPKDYFSRFHLEWIGRNVPRADAKWMGMILSNLSDEQIRDSFRAGGFSQEEIDGFVRILEERIAELTDL